jgi:probable rRNA maturation factor
VVLVDDCAMAELNRAYRNVAGATDVLAFPMAEGRFRDLSPALLGDVVISVQTARRQARPARGGLQAELALLLVHGLLHLVGYDHASAAERRRMWRRQQAILAACGIQASAGARPARGGPARPDTPPPLGCERRGGRR